MMPRTVNVHMLPQLICEGQLEGSIVVVLDILRATTTMAWGLKNGATEIIPCETIEQTLEACAARSDSQCLRGGERGGARIDGFELDNSPYSYERTVVEDRTVVMTTTNGTAALARSRSAARVLIGSFVALGSTLDAILQDNRDVNLVCAGTDGQMTSEDVLCAGAIATAIQRLEGLEVVRDPTRLAMDFFEANSQNAPRFLAAMNASLGGSNLQKLGYSRDIDFASRWHTSNLVAELVPESDSIRWNRSVHRTIPDWIPPSLEVLRELPTHSA